MTGHPLPPGVQVIERGWLSANMVVVTGPFNTAVIDSGYCTHAAQTVRLVQTALADAPLNYLLNTHLHSDHCGGNAALQAHFPLLQTWIPPGHASAVTDWDPVTLSHVPTGQRCPQFSYQGLLIPGHEIALGQNTWQIHAAPGHDPNAVILFEPVSRTLISADALWENGFGVVFPELEGDDAFAAVGATLELIAQLSPVTVIPGHGRVFAYSETIVERARLRLEAFISDPLKHARHAAKVLLKFKLLEVQQQDIELFRNWALSTPYFELVRSRFFASVPAADWINTMIEELQLSGAARREGSDLANA
ncbi:MAG: MBL fold metallo-hydrolase [Polaromonas sp.]|nr:MBL fold metallo-hydrolase [Polaromonas sp.]